jgi:proteasome lid subunit RPN8/RPN11
MGELVPVNTLELTEAVYEEILTHAREGKPQEVCGILRGRGPTAFQLVRGRNIAPDPIQDYVIDTQTLLRQFDFEEEGDEMVAIYHSHPVSPAYPSASDAWNAHYPDTAYIICSLEVDDAPVVRAFRLTSHNVSLDLARTRNALDFDETRPGRFAYYQAEDTPQPPVLADVCDLVPAPFYIVFETHQETGKSLTVRVVSVLERQIQVVSG